MNLLIMALEGILFVAIAVWYVWTIAQKVRKPACVYHQSVVVRRTAGSTIRTVVPCGRGMRIMY